MGGGPVSPMPRSDRALIGRQNQIAAKYRNRGSKRGPDPAGPTIHCDGCWCGKEHGHDWPGKDAGSPHPRESR